MKKKKDIQTPMYFFCFNTNKTGLQPVRKPAEQEVGFFKGRLVCVKNMYGRETVV